MFSLLLAILLTNSASAGAQPCKEKAISLFEEIAGQSPKTISAHDIGHNRYADAREITWSLKSNPVAAYEIRFFFLDERTCFVESVRFVGDL
jgi:hypothetical protein